MQSSATLTAERHVTSNALDSNYRLRDSYTLLRGALAHEIPFENGKLRLGAEFQASVYDRTEIEDDRALLLSLEATRALGDRIELRGTLSWRRAAEGDDLPIGPLILGTRTRTDTLEAGLEAGVDLGGGTVLVLGVRDTFDRPGLTSFQQDLIAPLRLEPRRNTVGVVAALTRKVGTLAYGLKGSINIADANPFPLGISYVRYALRGQAAGTTRDGTVLAIAAGGEWLHAEDGVFDSLRPSLRISAIKTLPANIELRGSFFAAFETRDSDDPLASWVQRLEIEASKPLTAALLVAAGYFAENRENLLLGYDERSKGVYGRIAYAITPKTAVEFRIDYKRDRFTVIDLERPVLAAYLGVTQQL